MNSNTVLSKTLGVSAPLPEQIADESSLAGQKMQVPVDIETFTPEYIIDSTTGTTYLKGKFLGKGGFARVHEVWDPHTNTTYAGKIIPKNRITKKHHMQKIVREILIHQSLVHNNVVRFHHYFEDSSNVYIILENCSRKSLAHVLKHRIVLSEPEVRYYLTQLVNGVSYIHSQEIIHRDLKPGNMFLGEDMVVKIGDFGLATRVGDEKKVTICGTPNYIAPEVLSKKKYGFEADVWAIGCIMYTMLGGQPPFETATLKETYSRILSNTYTPLLNVSWDARSLISQLLEPDLKYRLSIDEILKHDFFKNGWIPKTLEPIFCYKYAKFNVKSFIDRSSKMQPKAVHDAPNGNQDMKMLTDSVSTLKIISSKRSPVPVAKFSANEKVASNNSGRGVVTRKEKDFRQSSLKQKIGSVLCPDKMVLSRKRPNTAASLYTFLMDCFERMPLVRPTGSDPPGNPPPVPTACPLFVSKWIDYSNKYGFGFQLSNKSVGVLFNDNTRISFSPDRSRVEFHDVHGKVTAHPHNSVPSTLHERLMLLRYFSEYMDENLTEGGNSKYENQVTAGSRHKSMVPHMKRWVRTNTAIVMELCNETLQINFFADHTKVILSSESQGFMITYINDNRYSISYWLSHIARLGCERNIYESLKFAAAVVREFAEMDGAEFC